MALALSFKLAELKGQLPLLTVLLRMPLGFFLGLAAVTLASIAKLRTEQAVARDAGISKELAEYKERLKFLEVETDSLSLEEALSSAAESILSVVSSN